MLLVNNPPQQNAIGKAAPIPRELKKYLVSWADVECLAYDFGVIVRQTFVTADYSIHITLFQISAPVTLYPSWNSPTIALQYIREGKVLTRLKNGEEMALDASKYYLFHIAPGQHISYLLPGMSESLRIEINPTYLKDLLDAHPKLQNMLNELHKSSQTALLLSPAALNGKVKNILHNMYQCRKSGPSLQLEMKAHIYELLSAYDEEITLADDLETIQTSQTEKKIVAVQQYVIQHPHIHECSMESLSRQFNISMSLLKTHFKKQYSISLGEFVQHQCINKARELLLSGVAPVQDIAFQLGYTDVSNFSRAFRNHMGYSPNLLRLYPDQYKDQVIQND